MKKVKIFTLGLFATALALGGCSFFIKGSTNDTKPDTNQNTDSGNTDSGNTTGGGQTTEATLLDTLKGLAKPVAAKMLGKAESSVTFGEYEDENATADVFYYDSSSLTFVDVEDYTETFDTSLADKMVSYLPSGATLDFNNDYLDYLEDYGVAYYDRYYISGEYTYNIYVEAYDEYDWGDGEVDPAETYSCIYIYKTSQESAFDAYFSAEE